MAEKKRKVPDAGSSASHVAKKPKKSAKTGAETVVAPEDNTSTKPVDIRQDVVTIPKKSRKRAVDFLDDDEQPTALKTSRDGSKSKDKVVEALTADGTNGVVEHSDSEGVTISTSKRPKKKSMMAEAERTQDQELAEQFGDAAESVDEDIDATPALLAGFDSDNEDPAEDKDFDASRVAPIPQFKKTSKKLRKAKEFKSEGPGAVYIGRVPHGFYEQQMREYFSQFGTITRLRLSRNKKTGASKHFAFIEFESDEVAKIVAETMDNYLMFGHILKCKYAPEASLHPDVWKGANKKFRKIPLHKLARERAERPLTERKIDKKLSKERQKRAKKAEVLKAIGYEFNSPELKRPDADKSNEIDESTAGQAAVENGIEGALVPPPTVPKDELAVKVEEDLIKKSKKPKKGKDAKAVVEESPVQTEPVLTKRGSKQELRQSKADHDSIVKPRISGAKTKASSIGGQMKPDKGTKQLKGILKKSKKV